MNNKLFALSAICLLLLLSACLPRHTVILMPDPGGNLGNAEVSTAAGKQLLEKSADMTQVSGPSQPPAAVTTASPDYISITFAEALAVEPQPPEKFILFFETGKIALTPESQAMISAIAAASKRRGAISISISGHTDAAGSDILNEKLAHERAEFIRGLLLQAGIDQEKMLTSSHGKGNPLVPTPDGVAEPRNRRVEVVVR